MHVIGVEHVKMKKTTNPFPIRLMPFVGRQPDLERMLDLILNPSVRLVTIVGPGGVGKTRLAVELARALHDRFQHGPVFVPLAQLSTIDELLPALAGALGVQLPPGGDLQQAVLEHLASQQTLLVLDNFEHLLEEATLISEMLVNSPHVKVLVTSREKLNLEAETLYHLGGLQFPPEDSMEKVQDYGAVSLFLQKARQVQPGFSLNTANASAVIRICHLVGGNPLGILLAAAWLEHFSPVEVAGEIGHSLDFLSRQVRDADPRHSGMRAVFDSSFNRLDENLQAVFRKLALFRGGFDLAAAKAVAGADLPALIALMDKSLLTRDPGTGRYDLHELLRQYALARLDIADDHEDTLAAYANYYIAFICRRERQLISPSQMIALDEIQADFDNIRQACTAAINKRDFASVGAVLSGLYAFCDMRSRFYEGEAIFRLATEELAPRAGEPPLSAWALALLSWYDMRAYIEPFDSFEEVTLSAQSCLEQAISIHDEPAAAASLVLLGAITEDQGDFKTAIQHYQKAMQFHPLLDDVYFTNIRIALCYQALKEFAQAIQVFRLCLQRGRETGEQVKTAWSLFNIGETLLMLENPAEAGDYLDQACTLFEKVGTTLGLAWCKYCSSRAAIALGDYTRGRELAEAASKFAHQIHYASGIAKTEKLLQQIDPKYSQVTSDMKSQREEPLSARELEVLHLLRSDLSGPAISRSLIVSLNTVRYHTKNIYRKLGAGTRLEAIQRAKELGL
jgi:predicted ATPase/DNA-binding CsgD family transcriptional regulator/Tfp pilus assembly protein PilF